MKRRIHTLAASLFAVALLAAPASAAPKPGMTVTTSGLNAYAELSLEVAEGWMGLWLHGAADTQTRVKTPGSQPERFTDDMSMIGLSWGTATGGVEVTCMTGEGFEMKHLDSASMEVTDCLADRIEWVCDEQGCNPTFGTVLLSADVTWTGSGDVHRYRVSGKASTSGYWESWRTSGTQREATVTGWVVVGSDTYMLDAGESHAALIDAKDWNSQRGDFPFEPEP